MFAGKGCIAIVEDDAGLCKALARLLRSVGFDARTFASAEAFLDRAAVEQPDCLILDIELPGMSGIELSRRLETGDTQLPTIFITAHQENWESDQSKTILPRFCLHKPFSASLLLGAIRTALNPPHRWRQEGL